MSWREKARCRTVDPELFFPVAGEGSDIFKRQAAEAVAECRLCPVRLECLTVAVDTKAAGIWGGTTEGERRNLVHA